MVNVLALLLMAIGLFFMLMSGWVVIAYRRQQAAGTTTAVQDIAQNEMVWLVSVIGGAGLFLIGLVFTLRSL